MQLQLAMYDTKESMQALQNEENKCTRAICLVLAHYVSLSRLNKFQILSKYLANFYYPLLIL